MASGEPVSRNPVGGSEAAGGQQRLDLSDGLGHGAPVDVEQLGPGA
jgi:hypothetical protein